MKKATIIPVLAVILGVMAGPAGAAPATEQENKARYVQEVVKVLRIHMDALRSLVTHKIKYSDNLVRHALALKDTFGLLGPMDWHAAKSAAMRFRNGETREIDARFFERMANTSEKSLKRLVMAAHEYMEDQDRVSFLEELDQVKETCNSCHRMLPQGIVPDVWGNRDRQQPPRE